LSAPVQVAIDYPAGYLVLRDPVMASPGTLRFRIDAPLDTPVVIESSPDLEQWTTLATVTNVTTFSQPIPANQSRQFYRAHRP